MLDLSAAFDTIEYAALPRRLHGDGISGEAHTWLTSYVQGRTSVMRVKKGLSQRSVMKTGVSQGPVLGHILNAYNAPLMNLPQLHNIQHHLYAYDTQLHERERKYTTEAKTRAVSCGMEPLWSVTSRGCYYLRVALNTSTSHSAKKLLTPSICIERYRPLALSSQCMNIVMMLL